MAATAASAGDYAEVRKSCTDAPGHPTVYRMTVYHADGTIGQTLNCSLGWCAGSLEQARQEAADLTGLPLKSIRATR